MSEKLLEPAGIIVPMESLQIPRAKAVVDALATRDLPFVRFIECRHNTVASGEMAETIVFEVEVERPQRPVNDIHRVERLAITFLPSDSTYPEVLALREDFPRVAHTNIRPEEFPRSLCLYDQPWPQIAIRWTAAAFIERIRFWLAETAKGSLHEEDQPLEQLIMATGNTVVLPHDLFDSKKEGDHEELTIVPTAKDCRVLLAKRGTGEAGLPFLALSFTARPQTHGAIRHTPGNLSELNEFLQPAGIPLLEALRTKLPDWNTKELLDKCLLMVFAFPMSREEESIIEASHTWAFLAGKTIAEIGVDIGVFQKTDHGYGQVIARDETLSGKNITLDVLSPQYDITPEFAAAASGFKADSRKIVAVGAGALGSQVVKTLALSGFGDWCVIDEDLMLPHNTVRHELGRWAIGLPKALALAVSLQSIYESKDMPKWFEADILRPGDFAEAIETQFVAADLLLDLAASIPVSRHLVHDFQAKGRRIAAFLNPRGTDLVILAEDRERKTPLDCLEMQYYRAVAHDEQLRAHLLPPEGRIRYARSCRDVSASIPNYLVKLHAGIAANAIRQIAANSDAAICVWRADPDSGQVRRVQIPVSACQVNTLCGWTLVVDNQLRAKMSELRCAKLPNETGGVLIGAYDLARKIVYAVDTIPSPPDSEEWPTLYIRGKRGLAPQVERIREATDGQLEYIGEWHSHPDGCSCLPSDDDAKVFGWLTKNMDDAGLPTLMAIAGQGEITAWFFLQLVRTGGWEVGG